jgi:4-amino-4-deoxy-L-arabinose transferase-like glycosyltransferase
VKRNAEGGAGDAHLEPPSVTSPPTWLLLLMPAVVLGSVLRLAPVLLADFPLQDGGLFATMAHDIRNAGFALPIYSSFNGGNVPFAYPPIGLYILALIPGDPITTERWLPLLWSVLAIPAAFLLARELADDIVAGVAAVIFAAMPVAWAIEGGGVTRALALALLLAALWRVAVGLRSPSVKNALFAGVLAGLAILVHPAVGPTGVASSLLFLAFRRSWRGAATLAGATVAGGVVVAPWLLFVVSRWGFGAILAAGGAHKTEETLGRFLAIGPSWIGTLDFVLPLALLGLVIVARRREWLLPVWVVLLLVVPGGEGRYAAIVWAILAATGVLALLPTLKSVGAIRIGAGVGIAWMFIAALLTGYQRFQAIPTNIRNAMVEAGAETPVNTRFAVIVDNAGMEQPVLDWFPTLSGRVSVGTFMGLEWTSVEQWDQVVAIDHRIQAGQIPPGVDTVFQIKNGTATWRRIR